MNMNDTKQKRVYVDMVGDLWHYGHVNFCRQAKELGDYLIVGITKDEDVKAYKRPPILHGEERVASAKGCRYVDEVLYDDVPLAITKEFIEKHRIDLVAHGNDFDKEKMERYYRVPMDMDILRILPYTGGISTTELLTRIRDALSSALPDDSLIFVGLTQAPQRRTTEQHAHTHTLNEYKWGPPQDIVSSVTVGQ
ncbi:hypothetical protein PROFUN_02331 [Planoprotostelium fungivorum]|uniref:ethanolamine-phosphate cytidylyltransferase n=1 Tax=Planoprotostelium fungivorum TaxID=1890364 RepID=A0A2P6NYL6_9EUKA|nr:hypothetical protein PROFUN_02331 [Planoprotostelium fungivorum]